MRDLTEQPTLEELDDMCEQSLRALVLGLVVTGPGRRPADMSPQEQDEVLGDHQRVLAHYRSILRNVVRMAAGLGERAVLEEMDKAGVERELLAAVVDRRRS